MTSSNASDEPSGRHEPYLPAGRIVDGGDNREGACAGSDQSGTFPNASPSIAAALPGGGVGSGAWRENLNG